MRPAGVIVIGALISGWLGCSVENDYELLSFFFDGVPEPGSFEAGGGFLGGGKTIYQHEPYATDSCLECHPNPSQMQLSRDDSTICLKCHEDIPEQYPFMHGAVIGNACLWCHDPHISTIASLLREPSPALCTQCHEQGKLSAPVTEHANADTNCLSCHFGHGGDDAWFLRDIAIKDTLNDADNADDIRMNEQVIPKTPETTKTPETSETSGETSGRISEGTSGGTSGTDAL